MLALSDSVQYFKTLLCLQAAYSLTEGRGRRLVLPVIQQVGCISKGIFMMSKVLLE